MSQIRPQIRKKSRELIKVGKYEDLVEHLKINNIEKYDLDYYNTCLFECSIFNDNTILVETHFNQIKNKTGDIYYKIGTYHKKLKNDKLALHHFKLASIRGNNVSNNIVATWYVREKNKPMAITYLLKYFNHETNCAQKTICLQDLFKLSYSKISQLLDKEIEQTGNKIAQIVTHGGPHLAQTREEKIIKKYCISCEFLKAIWFQMNYQFKNAMTLIEKIYKSEYMLKYKNIDSSKIIEKLNNVFADHKLKKRRHISLNLHLSLLIWFEYHKLHNKYYDLFCQHPEILKRVDKFIKVKESHYMKLEDYNVNNTICLSK